MGNVLRNKHALSHLAQIKICVLRFWGDFTLHITDSWMQQWTRYKLWCPFHNESYESVLFDESVKKDLHVNLWFESDSLSNQSVRSYATDFLTELQIISWLYPILTRLTFWNNNILEHNIFFFFLFWEWHLGYVSQIITAAWNRN